MVLMAAFMTQVGALQTAPILIAVVTAFLTMEAVEIPPGQPQAGPRSRGETSRPGLSATGIGSGPHRCLDLFFQRLDPRASSAGDDPRHDAAG